MKKEYANNEMISAFNTLKKALIMKGNKFTKNEFKQGIKSCGIPYNEYVWEQFKSLMIERQGNRHKHELNSYSFINDSPLYIGCLNTFLKNSRTKINEIKARNKKQHKERSEVIVIGEDNIQSAIQLLKQHGYKILAPQYVEI